MRSVTDPLSGGTKPQELLDGFVEYLSIVKGLGERTLEAYLADLRQLEERMGDPLRLENSDLLAFLSSFENKRTLNRKLASINAFYDYCHRQGMAAERHRIPMAKLPKSLPKYLSHEEIEAGLSRIDRSTLAGKRDYALILFLYASGCRISEALAAQRRDIADGWLKIRFAKGEKERIVPLAPVAIEALEEYLAQSDLRSSHLWLNYRGEPLSRVSAYKIVKKYLGVSPHVLRHSFASALILGGADLRVVQELLGHSSLITTQIYTHIERRHLQETVLRHHPMGENQC
ncbi:tyrosine-type recombinase/integrase [Nitratifractor sp.]